MKKIFILLFAFFACYVSSAQNMHEKDAGYSSNEALTPLTNALDFTVTFTDGTTANLYNTCSAGNSILLDFFYTTCSYCIQYAPIIDQAYVAHGSGTGNIKFWGIDNGNTDAQVITYKSTYGVTNPCASGSQGGGNAVCSAYSTNSQWSWTGYPTYSIVCPDKTYSHDVNYPPTATGFNSYFAACGTTGAFDENNDPVRTVISYMYPLPACDILNAHIYADVNSTVKIELYNIVGSLVYSVSSDVSKGFYNAAIDVSNLPQGSYMIRLSQNNVVKDIQKVLLAR